MAHYDIRCQSPTCANTVTVECAGPTQAKRLLIQRAGWAWEVDDRGEPVLLCGRCAA